MGENTRLLYDLMHYLEENDLDGLLLLVDFEQQNMKKSTVKPSDPELFPFFINLSASPHSLNVKLPSQESLCASVNLTSR
jgi:hypothetical protein